MKLGPVTKLDKRNTATSKIFDDDAMSPNCDVIVILPIYGQFRVIRKLDYIRIIILYIFIKCSLLSYKNRPEKSLTQL